MAAIRILHFADVHLGVENYGRLDPSTGLNSRLLDFCRCLDQAIDRGLAGDVDLVVFAGDAYRSRDPSPTHQREFARRIQRLSAAGIPVFLLVGNHDLPAAAGRANSVDIFETLAVPNVVVGRGFKVVSMKTRKGPIQIVALPWVNRSRVFTKEEFRTLTPDAARSLLEDRLAEALATQFAELDPDLPSILVGHLSVQGAVFGSERNVLVGDDIVLPKSVVCNPALDYVALGHIHRHQLVSDWPVALYSGSIERVDFGEEKEDKGYLIVDVQKGQPARFTFEKVAARRFVTLKVDGRGEDPMAAVTREIGRHDLADAVVRLQIETTPDREPLLNLTEIRRQMSSAGYVAGITRQIEHTDRPQHRGNGLVEMSPLEALAVYLESKQVPAERTRRLLELGEALMRGGR
ncbi:MAG TPA: exonuclease SbcCD subunit D [Chloroflexota bacterium]|nr:exonuclease SbcCD subunit D [Chloroflexota bacterium]